MSDTTLHRPRLPAELYRPSKLWMVAFLSYAAALYVLPAVLLRAIATGVEGLGWKIVLMVPLTIVAGYGLNLVGFVGHEGMHLNLCRNKYLSALIGLFYASALVIYQEFGFAVQHWPHHRYTNQASDHDIYLVRNLKQWWQRLLLARLIYNWAYLKYTLRAALGYDNSLRYKMPFNPDVLTILARLNLLFAALWLTVYAMIARMDPTAAVFSIALPYVVASIIASFQTFIDHAGTTDEPFRNAWSRTSPLMTMAYFGANYHLEHHLYPSVPCYRLPRVHKFLRENGTYARVKPFVEPRFWASYRHLTSTYEAGKMDQAFDPFVADSCDRIDRSDGNAATAQESRLRPV